MHLYGAVSGVRKKAIYMYTEIYRASSNLYRMFFLCVYALIMIGVTYKAAT